MTYKTAFEGLDFPKQKEIYSIDDLVNQVKTSIDNYYSIDGDNMIE